MKRIFLMAMLVVMLIGGGCSPAESPLKIELFKKQNIFGGIYIQAEVTSLADGAIVINDVIWNKGNCSWPDSVTTTPVTLSYGEKITVGHPDGCNVVNVTVLTDQGDWSVSI
jgi:hypothetical protein